MRTTEPRWHNRTIFLTSTILYRKVVDLLIDKMEKYANFGFDFMQDKLEDNPDYFYKETAFLQVFLNFMQSSTSENAAEEEEAESLD